MTMRSTNLLPVLQELPTGESCERMSFQDMMTGLVGTDRAAFAAEFASAVSLSLWGVFDRVNVNDSPAVREKAIVGGMRWMTVLAAHPHVATRLRR